MIRVLVLLVLLATPALSHDWYTYRTDPVTGSRCCGGTDCKPVPRDARWITRTPQGLKVVMTLDETLLINPASTGAINEVIPWARVQEATIDEHETLALYDICITPYPMDERTRSGTRIYCIFYRGSAT